MKRIKNIFHFHELRLGIITTIQGLIPVTIVIIILEFLIEIAPYELQIKKIVIAESYDLKMLIYYVVSGCTHMIICSIVAYYFFQSSNQNSPITKNKVIRRTRFTLLFSVFLLVYILDAYHIKLAYLSHERLYLLMSKSDFFKSSFRTFPDILLPYISGQNWFRLFSIFPFILICFALSVMVSGSFYIHKELRVYLDKNELEQGKIKEFINDLNSTLKNYALLLSVVLVSSTIATVLFFQLPTSLIKDSTVRSDYLGVSMSMGVCWGVIFSLTLLFLCIYPYKLAHGKITSITQDIRVKDDPALEEWLSKHKNYYSLIWNMKLILSIVSPAFAGIFTTLISHHIL